MSISFIHFLVYWSFGLATKDVNAHPYTVKTWISQILFNIKGFILLWEHTFEQWSSISLIFICWSVVGKATKEIYAYNIIISATVKITLIYEHIFYKSFVSFCPLVRNKKRVLTASLLLDVWTYSFNLFEFILVRGFSTVTFVYFIWWSYQNV